MARTREPGPPAFESSSRRWYRSRRSHARRARVAAPTHLLRLPTFLGSNAVLQRAPPPRCGAGAPPGARHRGADEGAGAGWGVESDGERRPRRREPPRRRAPGSGSSASRPSPHGPFTSASSRGAATTMRVRRRGRVRRRRRSAFGDVWLCAGQSNMQFTVAASFDGGAHRGVGDGQGQDPNRHGGDDRGGRREERRAAATTGDAARKTAGEASPTRSTHRPRPIRRCRTAGGATWAGSPRRAGSTAAAVRAMFKEVPVGLIVAAWGQAIEPFSSRRRWRTRRAGEREARRVPQVWAGC